LGNEFRLEFDARLERTPGELQVVLPAEKAADGPLRVVISFRDKKMPVAVRLGQQALDGGRAHGRRLPMPTYGFHAAIVRWRGRLGVFVNARIVQCVHLPPALAFTGWRVVSQDRCRVWGVRTVPNGGPLPTRGCVDQRPRRDRRRAGLAREREDLLFYASFDTSPAADYAREDAWPMTVSEEGYPTAALVPGRFGRAVQLNRNTLCFDACGQATPDRGSLAFWLRLDHEPAWSYWDPVAMSTGLRGRAGEGLRLNWYYTNLFFLMGGLSTKRSSLLKEWKQGQWNHIALTWDQFQGLRYYEDGKSRAGHREKGKTWLLPPFVDVIGFGSRTSGRSSFAISRRISLDEFYTFCEVLAEEDVASLFSGQPLPSKRLDGEAGRREEHRDQFLRARGWTAADRQGLPVLSLARSIAGPPAAIRVLPVEKGLDAKRIFHDLFSGEPAYQWPHSSYRSDLSGRQLEVYLTGAPRLDHVRLRCTQDFEGKLIVPGRAGKRQAELPIQPSVSAVRRIRLARPVAASQVHLLRTLRTVKDGNRTYERGGYVHNVDLYGPVEPSQPRGKPRAYRIGPRLSRSEIEPGSLRRILAGETRPGDERYYLLASESADKIVGLPALGPTRLFAAPAQAAYGVTAVEVQLALASPPAETVLGIEVRDPRQPGWRRARVSCRVRRGDGNLFRLAVDFSDFLVREGQRLQVVVTPADELRVEAPGSRIIVYSTPPQDALPSHTREWMKYLQASYSETAEGHAWDVTNDSRAFPRVFAAASEVFRCAPDSAVAKCLAGVTWLYDVQFPHFPEPKLPTGVPDWAHWQARAIAMNRKVTHWLIDHRQVANGQFDGAWNDDTALVENWCDFVLMGGDEEIREAIRKTVDGVWTPANIRDGFTRYQQDVLHAYEQGSGVQMAMLLLDYGDPVRVERVLGTCSNLPNWTLVNERGHRHFRACYFQGGKAIDRGEWAYDLPHNALVMLHPMMLAWYNRHPLAVKYMTEWAAAWAEDTERATLRKPANTIPARIQPKTDELFARPGGKMPGCYGLPPVLHAAHDFTGEEKYAKALRTYLECRKGFLRIYLSYRQATGDTFQDPLYRESFPTIDDASHSFFPRFHIDFGLPHYFRWKLQGSRSDLAHACRLVTEYLTDCFPLLTWACPSVDRIQPTRTTLSWTMLGGQSWYRPGYRGTYPDLAVSYEGLVERLAAVVLDNAKTRLRVDLLNLDTKPHSITVRVWNLDNGLYELRFGERTWQRELRRHDAIRLVLPPRELRTLHAKQLKKLDPAWLRADLALSPREVRLAKDGTLCFTAHNIGTQPVRDVYAEILDSNGGVLKRVGIGDLPGLTTFEPVRRDLRVPGMAGAERVRLATAKPLPEITEANNQAALRAGE